MTIILQTGFENDYLELPFTDVNSTIDTLFPHTGLKDSKTTVNPATGSAPYADLGAVYPVLYVRCYARFAELIAVDYIEVPIFVNVNGDGNFDVGVRLRYTASGNQWGILVVEAGFSATVWEDVPSAPVPNRYYCVELLRDGYHGIEQLWIDGQLRVIANVPISTLHGDTQVYVGIGWNADLGTPHTVYIDDLVVADSYIGPISSGKQFKQESSGAALDMTRVRVLRR